MNNGGVCLSVTRGGKKGSGQLAVSSDLFDRFDHIHQPPHHRRDSPVTQNPAERMKESTKLGQIPVERDQQKEKTREKT